MNFGSLFKLQKSALSSTKLLQKFPQQRYKFAKFSTRISKKQVSKFGTLAIATTAITSCFRFGIPININSDNSKDETPKNEEMPSKTEKDQYLNNLIQDFEEAHLDVLEFNHKAIKLIARHLELIQEAFETEGDVKSEMWSQICLLNDLKIESLQRSFSKFEESKGLIEEIEQILQECSDLFTVEELEARKKSLRNKSEDILSSYEEMNKAVLKCQKVFSKLDEVSFKSKSTFLNDFKSLFPDLDITAPLSTKDFELVLAQFYSLFKAKDIKLANQVLLEEKRLKHTLEQELSKLENDLTDNLTSKFEKELQEMKSYHIKEVNELKQQYREDLQNIFNLQLNAFSEYYNSQLLLQHEEYNKKWNQIIYKREEEIKTAYSEEIDASVDRLEVIEKALQRRIEIEGLSKPCEKIWLICQNLMTKLQYGNIGSALPGPVFITEELDLICQNDIEKNVDLMMLMDSIPYSAKLKGVWSSSQLIQRFKQVHNVCKKVALMNDGEMPLYKYILSHIQSFLIIESVKIPEEEINGLVLIDPTKLNNVQVLMRVQKCVDSGNLEQALRFASLLTGKSREVALDWMRNVKLHLETFQAINSVTIYASSLSIEASQ